MDPSVAKNLAACCLLKLGRDAEAISLLEVPPGDRSSGDDGYYLGVAFARQGRAAEAIRCLKEACRQPVNGQAAKQALLALLKRETQRKIKARDWDGAGAALSEALDIDSTDAELLETLSLLGNRLPVTYLKANRRAEAAAIWEEGQGKDPSDGKVAHCLSLLYYWDAQDLEGRKKGKEATVAWEGAIRNWVALRYNDDFWMRMKREEIFGKVSEKDVEAIRRRLVDRLSHKIAEYQNEYLTQGRTQDSRRMSQLSLKLSAEARTAEALMQVARSLGRQGQKADMPVVSGAFMLQHVGQLEKAQRLLTQIKTTQTSEASTEQLHWCLSPWVLPWVMVQERRFQEAIEYLDRALKKTPSSEDGHDLMATAYLEQGKLLASAGDVGKALENWKSGLSHVRARKKRREEIIAEAEKATVKEATRLQEDTGSDGLTQGIHLLEKARQIADTRRIKENLSERYTVLGLRIGHDESRNRDGRMAEAKTHLEKALELNPDNGQAKQNLAVIISDEGVNLMNRDRACDAISPLKRANQLSPGNINIRKMLSQALSTCGVNRWNQGNHTEGTRLLREALEIDPNNEHARKNFRAAAGL